LGIDLNIDTSNMTPEERKAAEAAALKVLEEKFAQEEAALMEELMFEEEAMDNDELAQEDPDLWAEVQSEQHAESIKKIISATKKNRKQKD